MFYRNEGKEGAGIYVSLSESQWPHAVMEIQIAESEFRQKMLQV